jgi:hypothetical protein
MWPFKKTPEPEGLTDILISEITLLADNVSEWKPGWAGSYHGLKHSCGISIGKYGAVYTGDNEVQLSQKQKDIVMGLHNEILAAKALASCIRKDD